MISRYNFTYGIVQKICYTSICQLRAPPPRPSNAISSKFEKDVNYNLWMHSNSRKINFFRSFISLLCVVHCICY